MFLYTTNLWNSSLKGGKSPFFPQINPEWPVCKSEHSLFSGSARMQKLLTLSLTWPYFHSLFNLISPVQTCAHAHRPPHTHTHTSAALGLKRNIEKVAAVLSFILEVRALLEKQEKQTLMTSHTYKIIRHRLQD